MFCTQCGANNDNESGFCKSCGARLAVASAPPQAPAAAKRRMGLWVGAGAGLIVVAALGAWFFLRGGGDSNKPLPISAAAAAQSATTAETPVGAASLAAAPTPTPTPQTAAGVPKGTDIRAADAIAIPLVRDGRSLLPVAASGGELLLDASRDVPWGDAQGPSQFDQHFTWWNPTTGAFRDAWVNESTNYQTILAFDDTRAVVRAGHGNYGTSWTVSIADFSTNVLTTIASAPSSNDVVRGASLSGNRLLLEHWMDSNRTTAEVDLFDLTKGTKTVLATHTGSTLFGPASMALDTAVWVEQASADAPAGVVVMDLKSGAHTTLPTPWAPGWCYLLSDAQHVVCEEDGPGFRSNTYNRPPWRKAIIEIATGRSVEFANDANFLLAPSGMRVVWAIDGTSPKGYYDAARNELHTVEASLARSVGLPELVGGWYTWTQPAASGQQAMLNVVRLP